MTELTPNRAYPLVHQDNNAAEDAARLRAALAMIDADIAAALTGAVAEASETVLGRVLLATIAEALAGAVATKAVTPAGLKAAIDASLATLVGSAPATLDTISEIATALSNNPDVVAALEASIATRLAATAYTAADVLAKLVTVDGTGSGLDADKLRGTAPGAFGLARLADASAAAAKSALALAIADVANLQTALDAKANAASLGAAASRAVATAAQYRNRTVDAVLDADGVWDAAAWIDLGNVSGTVTLDFAAGLNFKMVAIGNLSFAQPSNVKVGQSGGLLVLQDGTGGRTVSFTQAPFFPVGQTWPTYHTLPNGWTYYAFQVSHASDVIAVSGGKL